MIFQKITIENKMGLHARPASLLIQAAKKFESTILIEKSGRQIGLNSLTALLKLQVKMGDELMISAHGNDETDAVNNLIDLIHSKFGEK